jgi:phage gpG-like protein
MAISYSIDASATIKMIDQIEANIKDLSRTGAMQLSAGKGYKNVMKHFDDEKGPLRPWPKWSKRMPDGRRKFFDSRPTKRGGNKLLQDTGAMRGRIGFRANMNKAEIFTSNTTPYAFYHHTGTKKMPKRQFMYIDNETRKNIAEIVAKGVVKV